MPGSYTALKPQSQEGCVFIDQSVQRTDEIKYAPVGGEINDDGIDSIKD